MFNNLDKKERDSIALTQCSYRKTKQYENMSSLLTLLLRHLVGLIF